MNSYNCSRCQKSFNSYKSLRQHVGRVHKIHSITFHVEYNLAGKWPTCKCGCGTKLNWSAAKKSFRDYAKGHHCRVVNNWGHNPKAIAASAETRRKQFKAGERTIWCAGLSVETDSRLQAAAKKISEKFTEARRIKSSETMRANRLNGTIPTLRKAQHSQWKGGVSSINQLARSDLRLYKEWKYPILCRDLFKCTQCQATKDLQVHHNKETFSDIIKKVMTIEDYEKNEDFNQRKLVVDKIINYHTQNNVSGTTLCRNCHKNIHPSLNL